MIAEPKCSKRGCIHFIGILQPTGNELSEVPYCEAYPMGIPEDILDGSDLHKEKRPDQVGEDVFDTEE